MGTIWALCDFRKKGLEGGKEKNLAIIQLYFSWNLFL